MLQQFTQWLGELWTRTFGALWTLITDAFVWLVDGVLTAFSAVVALIPVPAFMSEGLAGLFGQLPPGVLWASSAMGVPQCLAIIGSGFAFRLFRKLVTFGQW